MSGSMLGNYHIFTVQDKGRESKQQDEELQQNSQVHQQ